MLYPIPNFNHRRKPNPPLAGKVLSTRQQGADWEQTAESFLIAHGLKTVRRNYQVRSGEIDLVMLDKETLVFVEVRYRGNDGHGSGAESVTWTKQKRIIRAAQHYLQRYDRHQFLSCRFDVVSIGRKEGRVVLDWVQSAFDAG